jgi:hypothetical protein
MVHSAVVLRNVGDGWKVLLFLPSDPLPELEALLRSFDRLGLEEVSLKQCKGDAPGPGRSCAMNLLVSPAPGEAPLRTQMPFGVGQQPHRSRIWAISRGGTISTSDWREIDFTN